MLCTLKIISRLNKQCSLSTFGLRNSRYIHLRSGNSCQIGIHQEQLKRYFDDIEHNFHNVVKDFSPSDQDLVRRLSEVRKEVINNIQDLEELGKSSPTDESLRSNINEESEIYSEKLQSIEDELFLILLNNFTSSSYDEIVLEVSAGVGGQEAMLFASDMFNMYLNFCKFKGWNCTVAVHDVTDIGGVKFGSLLIEGKDAYNILKFETGVHRVQRVPITERSGRIHTSTAAVAVLPQPKEIDIQINDKDLKIETKRSSGAGGQHVNTTDSAVRILHIPSGIVIESQSERSQIKNKSIGLKRLKAKLFEESYKSQIDMSNTLRKMQIGTSSRSDKVRTYNFVQDRVTDHRIGFSTNNIQGFLEGSNELDNVIEKLKESAVQKSKDLFWKSIVKVDAS